MRKYLVVANQTLGGAELKAEIQHRIAEGESEFHVLVPVTPIADYEERADRGGATLPGAAAPLGGGGDPLAANDEARKRARHRMTALVGDIRDAGATADGELGDPNPLAAIEAAIGSHPVDEIILSTFPQGISRWLKMDLPSRVERVFDGPVKTIISDV